MNTIGVFDETMANKTEDDKILLGLCHGPLLTNACQHILSGSGIECTEKHATKWPIASRLNIKNIMAKTIAYTACQDGMFSLLNFYYNIATLFSPSGQWAEETLASWDNKPNMNVNLKNIKKSRLGSTKEHRRRNGDISVKMNINKLTKQKNN
ncbi:hypothetical protein C0989_011968 [Termitomyces sp. Mn162]|nr:hypothetical protein C0989_011968 [Termitomyces sp. Mn162]